jgi:hypothetical protein
MTIITFEKVPKKLLTAYKYVEGEDKETAGAIPVGITLLPQKTKGFRKVQIMVQEKLPQYDTRIAIAHELFHCLQYLSGCELDEDGAYDVADVMVKALKDTKRKKK